ncbi:MAG TPA: hypothetical protein VGD59_01340 [Acidisarcina sp.]
MSTRIVPIDYSVKPEHFLMADQIGNEVYSSHYAERKAYRLIISYGTILLCGSMWLNFSLAHRPIANRYIRIDEMGRAQAIQYTDLNYSPREGEVRTYVTDWANYRYTVNRETIVKKYPLNYYFLSGPLASRLMATDNQNHLVSQVAAGQVESSEVQVRNVTIRLCPKRRYRASRWLVVRRSSPSTSCSPRSTRMSPGQSTGFCPSHII